MWNTAVLIKPPQKRDFVSWHQDVYYWGNRPEHVVGAWLAITDSTPESLARYIETELKKGADVAKAAGLAK